MALFRRVFHLFSSKKVKKPAKGKKPAKKCVISGGEVRYIGDEIYIKPKENQGTREKERYKWDSVITKFYNRMHALTIVSRSSIIFQKAGQF